MWQKTSDKIPFLGADTVHVWRASLALPAEQVRAFDEILSTNERERATRFLFENLRKRFIVSHGLMRRILSFYTDREAKELRFSSGPYGKPALASEFGGERIRFNFGSSHDLALYAVALDRDVGVDIEFVDDGFSYEDISERYFTTEESASIRKLPEAIRRRAFFDCWTRKEAFLKAIGQGLFFPLNRFVVSVTPGQPILLSIDDDSSETSKWSLQEILPAEGYVGALAVEGHGWNLELFEWVQTEVVS